MSAAPNRGEAINASGQCGDPTAGGAVGCLSMLAFSILASMLLTIVVNVILR
jgi:hypothetical protein